MFILPLQNSVLLSERVSGLLKLPLLVPCVRHFNNNETSVAFRGQVDDAVVIAQTESDNDWIELFLLLDALRDVRNLTLCITYMGYSRQDQQSPNESMATRMFSKLLETFSINRCIVVDNHSEPVLRISTSHISACKLFESDIRERYGARNLDRIALVSPDLGGIRRVCDMSQSLKCSFIMCNKSKNIFGELRQVNPMGNVKEKFCILIDDMVDSGATICRAAESLIKSGAHGVAAYCTHGIFSKGCFDRLEDSSISELVVTDTIRKGDNLPLKIRKISVDSLIADTIKCIV